MLQFNAKEIDGFNGLKTITPFYMEDERGFFLKGYEKDFFAKLGICGEIQEDFESFSIKNVIRGLHFQIKNPQAKLVRALTGQIYDVAVDLRKDSPSYGKWHAEILDCNIHNAYYIPQGFAHGFMVLSDSALVQYKCIGKYMKEYDSGIYYRDNDLKIDWPINEKESLIISQKDSDLISFKMFNEIYGII